MIEIIVNGDKKSLNKGSNIEDMLKKLAYEDHAFAVALNGTFVPLKEYKKQKLKVYDKIEILAPMQGG